MAIEKMVLLNLVGSLDDEHDILQELVLCENIHLNLEHGDIYDNNYMVHQYEAMMPHEALPTIENYAHMEQTYQEMEQLVLDISRGMNVELELDQSSLKKHYVIGDAKKDLKALHDKLGEGIDELKKKRNQIKKIKDFRKKAICINPGSFDMEKLNALNFFSYEIGMLSRENKMQVKKNYENITAVVLRIGDMKDVEEDIYLVIYPKQFQKETDRLLKSLNWAQLAVPEEVKQISSDLLESVDETLKQLEEEVKEIEKVILTDKIQTVLMLNMIYTRIKIEQKILTIKQEIIHGNNLFVLNAWILKKNRDSIEERIGNITDKFVIIIKDTKELDRSVIPPTKLKNNWLFKPFEMIVKLYGLPSYYEIDPTPFLAMTFMLMFGIMFGDIGQGFVYFVAGLLIMKKSDVAGGILTRLGLSSMCFGLVYGSFFGLEQHQLPWLPSVTGPVLSPDVIMPILLMGVVFGIVVLSVSYVIGIINALRRRDVESGVFGKNGIAGYIFFMGLVFTAMAIVKAIPVSPFVPLGVMGIMLIIMILKEPLTNILLKKKPYIHGDKASYFIESSFEGVETILAALSNGISFIRIGAFALNHAGLFMAFLVMSDMTSNWILKAIIILIGNVLILTLEGLVVFIQGLRLQYYEMFSKYFDGDGVEYAPIKIEK